MSEVNEYEKLYEDGLKRRKKILEITETYDEQVQIVMKKNEKEIDESSDRQEEINMFKQRYQVLSKNRQEFLTDYAKADNILLENLKKITSKLDSEKLKELNIKILESAELKEVMKKFDVSPLERRHESKIEEIEKTLCLYEENLKTQKEYASNFQYTIGKVDQATTIDEVCCMFCLIF